MYYKGYSPHCALSFKIYRFYVQLAPLIRVTARGALIRNAFQGSAVSFNQNAHSLCLAIQQCSVLAVALSRTLTTYLNVLSAALSFID